MQLDEMKVKMSVRMSCRTCIYVAGHRPAEHRAGAVFTLDGTVDAPQRPFVVLVFVPGGREAHWMVAAVASLGRPTLGGE